MYLRSIASAFPETSFTQAEVWDVFQLLGPDAGLSNNSMALLENILTADTGIEKRHFALCDPDVAFGSNPGALNKQFEKHAPALAGEALGKALELGGLGAGDIDALLVCTCTGYLCPGVSSYVAELLGMRRDVYLQDLVGLGCGAAIPLLRSAKGLLADEPGARVAVICVEVCSTAFYLDNDPGQLVSLCLFGDGASASIWTSGEADTTGWQAGNFATLHNPKSRERIRFVNQDGFLKNKFKRGISTISSYATLPLLVNPRPIFKRP